MKSQPAPVLDLIRQLGPLAFASRLRRLADRLGRDISRIYAEHEVDFEARWFPVTYLLAQRSPLAVTAIAEILQFTHPAVNQIAGQMERAGLLTSTKDQRDDRRRLLRLTPKGRATVRKLKPVWEVIRKCTAELIGAVEQNALVAITELEDELSGKEMYDRVVEQLYPAAQRQVRVVPFAERHAEAFRELNLEWLNRYFSVEAADRAVLESPRETIVAAGGAIFMAEAGGKPVGTAALIRHGERGFELAKMAVAPNHQRRGIGRQLVAAVIAKAEAEGARELLLATSTKLTAANRLYRKTGFRKVAKAPAWAPGYRRETIYLRKKLSP